MSGIIPLFELIPSKNKRVVIDTNCLVDAAFVAGFARKAIRLLLQHKYELVISQNVINEAYALFSTTTSGSLEFNLLRNIFDKFVREVMTIKVCAKIRAFPGVNKSDWHVVTEALEQGAWLLTSDTPLQFEMRFKTPVYLDISSGWADGYRS